MSEEMQYVLAALIFVGVVVFWAHFFAPERRLGRLMRRLRTEADLHFATRPRPYATRDEANQAVNGQLYPPEDD